MAANSSPISLIMLAVHDLKVLWTTATNPPMSNSQSEIGGWLKWLLLNIFITVVLFKLQIFLEKLGP
ncbi:hypothetical protein C8J56DRAFT_1046007 [Mycena floridula]|nr:hypothetical protein C8J56DRAFT_1046007 [Mycena floridula]